MPTTKGSDKTDKTDEAEVAAAEAEATPLAEPRDITVAVEITVSTTDPDVSDDEVGAAAKEQVTLPTGLWVNKAGGGQIYLGVVGAEKHEEPPVLP